MEMRRMAEIIQGSIADLKQLFKNLEALRHTDLHFGQVVIGGKTSLTVTATDIKNSKITQYTTTDKDFINKIKDKLRGTGARLGSKKGFNIRGEDFYQKLGGGQSAGHYFEYQVYMALIQKCSELLKSNERGAGSEYYDTTHLGSEEVGGTLEWKRQEGLKLPPDVQRIIYSAAQRGAEAVIEQVGLGRAIELIADSSNPKGDLAYTLFGSQNQVILELKSYKKENRTWINYFNINDTNLFGEGKNYLSFLQYIGMWENKITGKVADWEEQASGATWVSAYFCDRGSIDPSNPNDSDKIENFLRFLLQKGDNSINLSSKRVLIQTRTNGHDVIVGLSMDLNILSKALGLNQTLTFAQGYYGYGFSQNPGLKFYTIDPQTKKENAMAFLTMQKKDILQWSADHRKSYQGNINYNSNWNKPVSQRPIPINFAVTRQFLALGAQNKADFGL